MLVGHVLVDHVLVSWLLVDLFQSHHAVNHADSESVRCVCLRMFVGFCSIPHA